MNTISGLLGHDLVVSKVVTALGVESSQPIRITGPAGSGKSWAALQVGASWQDAGGSTIIAVGDNRNSNRDLYPFLVGLSELSRDWRHLATHGSRSLLRIVDTLAGTGGVASSIFDLLGSAFRQKLDHSTRILSAAEREIIFDIKRLGRGRPILLIADNAHWWDEQSISLLEQLRSERLREAIPQLAKLRVLLVDTAEDQPPVAPNFSRLISEIGEQCYRLRLCNRNEFGSVLSSLGLTKVLPDSLIETLYSICGGHLKLAEQIVKYVEDGGSIEQIGEHAIFQDIIKARLAGIGPEGAQLSEILSLAAVIGITFSNKELTCLAQDRSNTLTRLMRRARAMELVDSVKGGARFSHEVLRTYFLNLQNEEGMQDIQARLANCLAIIRPGDYRARWSLLYAAGQHEKAREMYGLAAVKRLRLGIALSHVLTEAGETYRDDVSLAAWICAIGEAYALIARGNYTDALRNVSAPNSSETSLLAAERNYVAALCEMEIQTAEGFAESRHILRAWISRVADEPEINIRLRILLQQTLVLSGMFDQARTIEKTVEIDLIERAQFDEDAKVLLNIQNRRASSINIAEVAEIRVKQAVSFFAGRDGQPARYPIELYRAQTNHCSILIKLGRYAEAYSVAIQTEKMLLDEQGLPFPRRDVLAHNLVLAGYRCGVIDIQTAVANQAKITLSPDGQSDNFLQQCNLCAFQFLAGDYSEGSRTLSIVLHDLDGTHIGESYLIYYGRTLQIAFSALTRNLSLAIEQHDALTNFIRSISWPAAPYVRRRHELLREILVSAREAIPESPTEADMLIFNASPKEIGPCWNHYSRLILCTELAFWSDS